MIEDCVIRSRLDIRDHFGTFRNATAKANRHRPLDDQLSEKQVYNLPDVLSIEQALFWSAVVKHG